jgi:hypothetical protein
VTADRVQVDKKWRQVLEDGVRHVFSKLQLVKVFMNNKKRRNMKRNLFSVLAVLLMAALLTSPVSAGRGIGFSSVNFSLGSLIADGFVTGLGKTDVTIVLDASGERAEVSCINNGGTIVPGQSSPRVQAVGVDNLAGDDQTRKNGKAPFTTETSDFIPWDVAGCPNSNWVGHIDFVFWTEATLTVHVGFNNPDGAILASQSYTCVTTRNPDSVSCTPVP